MKKCKRVKEANGDTNISECTSMKTYLNFDKTVFNKVMVANIDTGRVNRQIKTGKHGGYIYLSYCPFCGGDLQTSI